MVDIARLPGDARLTLASLSGTASRYATGTARDGSREDALAAVREVTTDPFLLGIEAGTAAADPLGISGPIVELLRAAGADMQVAADHEADTRARYARMGLRDRGMPPDGPSAASVSP